MDDLVMSPRGPKCVGEVSGWCGGQKPGGEVAYGGKVRKVRKVVYVLAPAGHG